MYLFNHAKYKRGIVNHKTYNFFTMYLFFISGKLVTPIHHLVIIVVAIFVGGIDENL
jgi:hypothetical protein